MTFRVVGMHCPACEFLVADEVAQDPQVTRAQARLSSADLEVDLQGNEPAAALRDRWNQRLDPMGYRLFLADEDPRQVTRGETIRGLSLGAAVLAVLAALELSGVLGQFSFETLEPSGAFLLGILASVSSCFALVGGLLVSYSAAVGRRNPARLGPGLWAFHGARLTVFAVGGGVLGLVGGLMGGALDLQRVLLTVAALVMAGLGLNLLGLRWGKPKVGSSVGRARGWASWGTVGGGGLLGAGTFFLPCGFTQSVQFQALASGSFGAGALLTLAFALGTLPVLGAVGWFLNKGLTGSHRAVLLKAGGTLVLGLGLFQLWGALHLWGVRW